ncbi:MarR family winged helix-turn-helix transcriptional regulator [Neofamilia massiliensis]|uniref:MarR family winged helix-turn-helix transcriptional regulator n=1 Tax=Neofamilia massiliensis TaxID=1673724 RepID=UPI0006BB9969|nr:MarR family winged helix-turn-helix transcriptional regulator [Neofamilia massiliensis]
MKKQFLKVYNRFKLDFYRTLNMGENKEDSLTVSESFCLEVINGLKKPTVRDVASFMKISQPNAAYKISNLEDKGYITKTQSKEDKRVFYLNVTKKYDKFSQSKNKYLADILDTLEKTMSPEDIKKTEEVLKAVYDHLPTADDLLK